MVAAVSVEKFLLEEFEISILFHFFSLFRNPGSLAHKPKWKLHLQNNGYFSLVDIALIQLFKSPKCQFEYEMTKVVINYSAECRLVGS